MRSIDNDCLIMSKIQGNIFVKSIKLCNSSSAVFIKRYMNSLPARSMDKETFLVGSLSSEESINIINEEFKSDYGNEKYSEEEMYWIGYLYRVWSYVYNQRSKDIIKICSPKQIRTLYYSYHTLDPLAAINRILEARGINYNIDLLTKSKEIILNKYHLRRLR